MIAREADPVRWPGLRTRLEARPRCIESCVVKHRVGQRFPGRSWDDVCTSRLPSLTQREAFTSVQNLQDLRNLQGLHAVRLRAASSLIVRLRADRGDRRRRRVGCPVPVGRPRGGADRARPAAASDRRRTADPRLSTGTSATHLLPVRPRASRACPGRTPSPQAQSVPGTAHRPSRTWSVRFGDPTVGRDRKS